MAWILNSSDPACLREADVGGKAASLARLAAFGANVPPFRVISTAAFRALGTQGPDVALEAELSQAFAVLDAGQGISVRSSAIGEDAADSSFAGLYHTALGVRDPATLRTAVRDCWASYGNDAARSYRAERGVGDDGAMAVVLQRMVIGEFSGVCFTAHPVTQALSRGLINSVPGLGEALVSGTLNPEEITLDANSGQVLERAGERGAPLPDAALAEVWAVSKAIAEHLAFPQDVEWSWAGGRLHVLQSRPITTIADVFYSRYLEPWQKDAAADPDDPGREWSRMLADETWVSPISPLFYNIHNSTPGRVGFLRSHGDRRPLPPDMFKYHRATAYVDVRVIRRMYEYQPRSARIRGILNFVPASQRAAFADARWRWRGRLRRMLSYELSNRRVRSIFNNYRYVERQWPAYVQKSDRWLDLDLDRLTLEELRAHQADVQTEMAAVGPPCAIAVLSHASDLHLFLTGLLERWFRHLNSDGENLYARISSGLDDSETLRENETLWELAQRIRALGPDLLDFARGRRWSELRPRLEVATGGAAIIADFERFWRAHRHLGSSYKDVIWPRWGDDVELCFAALQAQLGSRAERPRDIHARSAASRRAACEELLAALRGPLAPLRRATLRWLFRYNLRYMAVRDNHRYYIDRNWYEVRRIHRSFGRRLVDAGVLTERDEVFFLGLAEVQLALSGGLSGAEAARRIRVRRTTWNRTLREQGPKFLRGWSPYEETRPAVGLERELAGIAASPGSAVGIARVVYEVSGLAAVADGEILVTRQTDPSWTSVFGRIAGLVLETGGVLSHGTSLCREYALPCVTAVERATMRIPDGSRIELHGGAGRILLLGPA